MPPDARMIFPADRPSLRGAKLRTQRAASHIAEIESVITQWSSENANTFVMTVPRSQLEGEEGYRPKFDWSQATSPPSAWVGIVAGEALYNLRAALDYLVHALAWLDSGMPQDYTQFPIAGTADSFQTQRTQRLVGINNAHVDALAEYQPFNGCQWTATLQELSNPDKHRTLTSVYRELSGSFRIVREHLLDDPTDPDRLIIPQSDTSVELRFWNDRPVVNTLTNLARETAQVLQIFQIDFGESDELTMAK